MIADFTRRRLPIPPPYDNPPVVDRRLFATFLDAFAELSAERRPSERGEKTITVYRIAARDTREWADRRGYGSDLDFLDELRAYVGALDTVWVQLEVERLKKGPKHGKS